MKIAIALLMVIHGVIHLLGFFKAYDIAEIEELKQPVTKKIGILWLIAFLIFAAMAVFFLAEIKIWMVFGISGLILSQALIIQTWQDAKFGTIPNIFLGVLLFISF
ncbi:MAG: hypothetical protein WD022_07280 [Balneolaceae bacterium]